MSETACGTITVSVSDKCGRSASISARVTNAGQWVRVDMQEATGCNPAINSNCTYIFEAVSYVVVPLSYPAHACPNPVTNPHPTEGCDYGAIYAFYEYHWEC